jgi:thiamine pyrophosphokinase
MALRLPKLQIQCVSFTNQKCLFLPPTDAFETILKRSKKLQQYFENLEGKEAEGLKYCRSNWHFKVTFESFLLGMVKEHEITKEFNSLNRKTADKIERFIKEKLETSMSYEKNQLDLEKGLREFDKELRVYTTKFEATMSSYANFFDDFDIGGSPKVVENGVSPEMVLA